MPPSPQLRFRSLILLLAAGASLAWLVLHGLNFAPAPQPSNPTASATFTSTNAKTASTPSPPAATSRTDEPWREPVSRPGVDASNLYKNAFVLFDRLTEEEKKMIRQPREEVDAEKAAALFEKIRAILELLRAAAKAEYCDWGQAPYRFDTPLPQLGKAQDLGKLGLWAAAYQFPTDPAAALETLADRATLGHHLADTLIGVLVQTSFEKGAHELLLQNAGGFDGATAARARELVMASQLDDDVAPAFAAEAESVLALGQQLAAMAPAERAQMLAAIGGASSDGATKITPENWIPPLLEDPGRLAAEIAFVAEIDRAAAKALTLPEAEYQAWRKSAGDSLADHPLAQMTVVGWESVQKRLQQMRVERTLFDAGLAVQQGGPAQLANYRDPATGNALTYLPTAAGFELRATYQVKGKAVALTFPQLK